MLGKLGEAIVRALFQILLTFLIALVVVAAIVEGVAYLTKNGGGGSLIIAIVAGVIIGIIAGFVALIVEVVRGVEAGVHEVESGLGDVAKGVESATHHDQPKP